MKTVALLLMARMALAWICVFGGNTPFASLVMIDFGNVRSCPRIPHGHQYFPSEHEERCGSSTNLDCHGILIPVLLVLGLLVLLLRRRGTWPGCWR